MTEHAVEIEDSVAHMEFEPLPFDLDSIPNNEQAAKDMAEAMPIYRMAAVMLGYNDKQLEELVRKAPESVMQLAEAIADQIRVAKSRIGLLEPAFCRLCVVLERLGEDEEGQAAS